MPSRRIASLLLALAGGVSCRGGADRSTGSGRAENAGPQPPASTESARSRGSTRLVFEFRDKAAYCRTDDCSGAPVVSIHPMGSDQPLLLDPGRCAVRCSDCRDRSCPKSACSPMGVAMSDTEYLWDGRYYEASTCGAGVACASERFAEKGRYAAELCAIRGSRTIDSIGAPQCIENGERKCASLEFDFPSEKPFVATF